MTYLKLITFDITGTLLKFKPPVWNQYAAIAAKHDIQADPEDLKQNFKGAWKKLNSDHPNFGKGGLGWQEWWRQIVLETFKGTSNSQGKLNHVAQQLIKHFETRKAYSVVEGGEEVLQSLKGKDLTLGVISNFDPRLHLVLDDLNLTRYFSFVLTSYEFGVEKPDKRIFLEAMRLGKVLEADRCFHLGNDKALDYGGARQVGMRAALVGDTDTKEDGVEMISDIREVLNLLKF